MSDRVARVTATAVANETRAWLEQAGIRLIQMEGIINEEALFAEIARGAVIAGILRGPAPLTLSSVILTPHIASFTTGAALRMGAIVAHNT